MVGIKKFRHKVELASLLVWHFDYKLLSAGPGSVRLMAVLNNLRGLFNVNGSVILCPFPLDTSDREKCKEHHQHFLNNFKLTS